jgi:salicylate biosynthesis isochorismate synthase
MLVPVSAIDTLVAELARQDGELRSASVAVDIDPLDLVRAGLGAVGNAAFFSSPAGREVAGLGAAYRVSAEGPSRLRDIDHGVARLAPSLRALVGFAFDPRGPSSPEWGDFASAAAVVPEIAVERVDGRSRLIVALPPGSDGRHVSELLAALDHPGRAILPGDAAPGVEGRSSPQDWVGLAEDACEAIESGDFAKVVLARSVLVRPGRGLRPFDLVAHLRDLYPACYVFGWQEGRSTFVGASPELLVSRHGADFRAEPLAGSAPRGVDAEDDRRLGEGLLASEKDRVEHAIVVDDAVARLGPVVDEIEYPPQPQLQRFAAVQHLATPIRGRTRSRLLALAEALHPTAAVGGVPRGAALDFIDQVEGIDRGWYAGGIGWADASGDGDLAVGLRCALVSQERATLFAGSGIVAGSDPAAEFEETGLKLRPMLDLMTGV